MTHHLGKPLDPEGRWTQLSWLCDAEANGEAIALTLDMAIDKHPDLADRTFMFACAIVKFCLKLSAQACVARQIAWQLADAGTSIAANYEEAKAAYSRRDFKAKTSIILKEARESRLWLRVIAANGLARREELDSLLKESNELVAIFTPA
jgi:four helix bundle protein